MLSAAQSAVTKHAALDGAILHLLQCSKTMTRKTYIGTPHRDSISGQSLVSVSDGRKCASLLIEESSQVIVGEAIVLDGPSGGCECHKIALAATPDFRHPRPSGQRFS